jgi:hypothetical protein
MKNIKKLLVMIIFLISLVINMHLLFSVTDNEINWSWLFDTELHPWGIPITNLLYSLSNLTFFTLGLITINEKFLKDDSLTKRDY